MVASADAKFLHPWRQCPRLGDPPGRIRLGPYSRGADPSIKDCPAAVHASRIVGGIYSPGLPWPSGGLGHIVSRALLHNLSVAHLQACVDRLVYGGADVRIAACFALGGHGASLLGRIDSQRHDINANRSVASNVYAPTAVSSHRHEGCASRMPPSVSASLRDVQGAMLFPAGADAPPPPPLPARAAPRAAPLVAASLVGGLGNRMFQLQSLLGIAVKAGGSALVARTDLDLLGEVFEGIDKDRFPLRIVPMLKLHGIVHRHYDDLGTHFVAASPLRSNTVVRGYMQSLLYLVPMLPRASPSAIPQMHEQARALLRSLWRFRAEHLVAARALLASRQDAAWVGVHYRVFPPSHTAVFDEMMPADVDVQAAIDEALATVRHPGRAACVMIFSNDPQLARSRLSAPCILAASNERRIDPLARMRRGANLSERSEGWATDSGRDLAALTMCDALVLTGGTYSFFAGMLHAGASDAVWAPAVGRLSSQFAPSWRRYNVTKFVSSYSVTG